MSAEDDIDFRQAMHDVRRLNASPTAKSEAPHSHKHSNRQYTRARINQAVREAPRATPANPASTERGQRKNEAGAAQLFFARPGLPAKSLKTLRSITRFPEHATLDLHGHTQATAPNALGAFIEHCQSIPLKHALIIHGKGLRAENGAKLKPLTAHWLEQHRNVLAYASAHPQAGGTGALAVLFKSSSSK